MDKPVDKRGKLDDEVFSYQAAKDDKVFLFWQGKRVMILSGQKAARFLEEIRGLDGKEAQLKMAKVTGHFKHGNEKSGKSEW